MQAVRVRQRTLHFKAYLTHESYMNIQHTYLECTHRYAIDFSSQPPLVTKLPNCTFACVHV